MPRGDTELEQAVRDYLEHDYLIDNGLLDAGQPTRVAHERHVAAAMRDFTGTERQQIRYLLGMDAGDAAPEVEDG